MILPCIAIMDHFTSEAVDSNFGWNNVLQSDVAYRTCAGCSAIRANKSLPCKRDFLFLPFFFVFFSSFCLSFVSCLFITESVKFPAV